MAVRWVLQRRRSQLAGRHFVSAGRRCRTPLTHSPATPQRLPACTVGTRRRRSRHWFSYCSPPRPNKFGCALHQHCLDGLRRAWQSVGPDVARRIVRRGGTYWTDVDAAGGCPQCTAAAFAAWLVMRERASGSAARPTRSASRRVCSDGVQNQGGNRHRLRRPPCGACNFATCTMPSDCASKHVPRERRDEVLAGRRRCNNNMKDPRRATVDCGGARARIVLRGSACNARMTAAGDHLRRWATRDLHVANSAVRRVDGSSDRVKDRRPRRWPTCAHRSRA